MDAAAGDDEGTSGPCLGQNAETVAPELNVDDE